MYILYIYMYILYIYMYILYIIGWSCDGYEGGFKPHFRILIHLSVGQLVSVGNAIGSFCCWTCTAKVLIISSRTGLPGIPMMALMDLN